MPADTTGQVNDAGTGPVAGRRRGIQSVEIGLTVLDALSELGGAAPLGEIAQRVNMAPPQVHRYLQSLIAAGMARQEPASGRYDLGHAALRLGLSALSRTDAFKLVDRVIGEYVRTSGRTILIAALGPSGPTVVRWYMGRPAVVTSLTVGSTLPLLVSATGRVFVTFSPETEIADLLDREMGEIGLDHNEVEALRRDVRNRGHARVTGTLIPGLAAVAFPIFDLQGRPTLVASVTMAKILVGHSMAALTREMSDICRTISIDLGWRPSA